MTLFDEVGLSAVFVGGMTLESMSKRFIGLGRHRHSGGKRYGSKAAVSLASWWFCKPIDMIVGYLYSNFSEENYVKKDM